MSMIMRIGIAVISAPLMFLAACTTTHEAPPEQAAAPEATGAAVRLPGSNLHEGLDDGLPLFARGSDTVDAKTRKVLSGYARTFLRFNTRFRIEGHADDCNDKDSDQRLSERRAENVRRELLALGVPADRIASVSGFGSDRPLAKSPPCSSPFHDRVELNFAD